MAPNAPSNSLHDAIRKQVMRMAALGNTVRAWVDPDGVIPIVRHPLFESNYASSAEPRLRELIQQRQAVLETHLAERDYAKAVRLFRPACQLEVLAAVAADMAPRAYWETLRLLWDTVVWPHEQLTTWQTLFAAKKPERDALMDNDERFLMSQLPEQLVIWRGDHRHRRHALSWTLDQDYAQACAERIARTFGGKPVLTQREIRFTKVLAYIKRPEGSELLVL